MRIGIDARLPYYRSGGISRYVIKLIRALAAVDGNNHYTILQSRKDTTDRVPPQNNFERKRLWTPCHHRFERYLLGLELLPQQLDVMHSPDFIPPVWGAAKYVITVHDLNFLHYPQFLTRDSKRYYVDQIAWATQRADWIIADSEHTRRDLIVELSVPEDKIATIHLAADPLFGKVARRENDASVQETLNQFSLRPGYILFVGTLEPRKNISTLLSAYTRLREQTSLEPQLVLVGSKGWLYDDIFAAIDQLPFAFDVHHLDGVTDTDLAHLYLAAGALAMPSHYEGFGLPVLEAMHCRCPVVASNRASLPEVVGDAGLLLDPDDDVAWAETLGRVLADEALRHRMIAAGEDWVAQFTWERTALATREIYDQLA